MNQWYFRSSIITYMTTLLGIRFIFFYLLNVKIFINREIYLHLIRECQFFTLLDAAPQLFAMFFYQTLFAVSGADIAIVRFISFFSCWVQCNKIKFTDSYFHWEYRLNDQNTTVYSMASRKQQTETN